MGNQKLKDLLRDYLFQTTKEVKRLVALGRGRQILGEVINRPEDLEIGIDRVGEKVLRSLLKKYNIKAIVFSEPDNRDIKNGNLPEFYGSIDPFDGSALFMRGFEHNWYTALTFFDKNRDPVLCGIGDILNEKFYFSDESGSYSMDLKNGKKKDLVPSKRNKLSEPIVLASYVMSSQYSPKFLEFFGDLLKAMHPKALLYPQGGSFIYAFLAAGLVDAYVMFDEPRTEIDPGYAIAKRAGCSVVTIDYDGTYKDYEFTPGRQHDKVDLLIATSAPEIRDQLIKHYLKKYAEKYSFKS
jgi:fructose-1,6-bisphosphatase/inositol monophosphatase family enzyme